MPNGVHRFAGRTAIVSGGAGGMGAACVERLSLEGARVFALDIDGAKAEGLAGRLRAEGYPVEALAADVTDEVELTKALAMAEVRAGQVDILINIAGGSAPGLIAELDVKTWDRLYALNVRSTVIACRAVLPSMRRQKRGSIVNMASISGLRGDPGWAAYNSAKAAIINLTQCLAWEEGRRGIRANAVCPGPIASPRMVEGLCGPTTVQAYDRACAIGRIGRPEEAAAAILFLASDDASFVTGAALVVDGGLTARTGQPTDFDQTLGG
jgi:meso-butanediol dehydrogenase / (S,S)-butanediol dehydrogenase / diacetyl reductase